MRVRVANRKSWKPGVLTSTSSCEPKAPKTHLSLEVSPARRSSCENEVIRPVVPSDRSSTGVPSVSANWSRSVRAKALIEVKFRLRGRLRSARSALW